MCVCNINAVKKVRALQTSVPPVANFNLRLPVHSVCHVYRYLFNVLIGLHMQKRTVMTLAYPGDALVVAVKHVVVGTGRYT
jgi:hypothetical protein